MVFVVFLLEFGSCSYSVVFFVFLLELGAVPTVRYLLFSYWSLELCLQCGICCFSGRI